MGKPEQEDVVVVGKKGLDAFPGTDLEAQLKAHGVETIALAGFLTNCCVESTMRTAFEKGFNVVTLTDCTAATSLEGQKAAVEGTYGMFSTPMCASDLVAKLEACTSGHSGRRPKDPSAALERFESLPRSFAPARAKGGAKMQANKTAVLFIEYQNEFTTEGGKLHGAVKEVMVANDKLFIAGTWNAEICASMKPEQQDAVIMGKKGLDAFPGTNLETQLRTHGIETIALAGFLTNCCVES